MPNLYDITGDIMGLREMATDPELPEGALDDTFEALEGLFNDKCENICKVLKNIEAEAAACKAEADRLLARKKIFENDSARLADFMHTQMKKAGIKKIDGTLFTILSRQGTEVVIIDDEDEIPDDFVETEVVTKVDKKKVMAALKAGTDVPGAHKERRPNTLNIK